MRRLACLALALAALLAAGGVPHAAPQGGGAEAVAPDTPTPQERMRRRFPQPARMGDLVGLALLDGSDRTIGRVEGARRTAAGAILLLVRRGAWFGIGGDLVAVPIEAVAMLGRQIALLDIPRDDFLALPAWRGGDGAAIATDETIRVALTRR